MYIQTNDFYYIDIFQFAEYWSSIPKKQGYWSTEPCKKDSFGILLDSLSRNCPISKMIMDSKCWRCENMTHLLKEKSTSSDIHTDGYYQVIFYWLVTYNLPLKSHWHELILGNIAWPIIIPTSSWHNMLSKHIQDL